MVSKANRHRYLPVILLTTAVTLLGVGAFAVVRGILSSAPGQPKQVIQEIHLMRPPPPPPDLPPPPPPPPEEKVQVQEKPPDAKAADEPPPGQQLGLDAAGGAGGDAFGLLGLKGGRDLLASGGSAFVWYAGLLKNEILETLQNERDARRGSYAAEVRVWVAADGTIQRAHLSQSTGDSVRDKAIEAALSHLSRLSQAPPADMPQPITLRIVSRA